MWRKAGLAKKRKKDFTHTLNTVTISGSIFTVFIGFRVDFQKLSKLGGRGSSMIKKVIHNFIVDLVDTEGVGGLLFLLRM